MDDKEEEDLGACPWCGYTLIERRLELHRGCMRIAEAELGPFRVDNTWSAGDPRKEK